MAFGLLSVSDGAATRNDNGEESLQGLSYTSVMNSCSIQNYDARMENKGMESIPCDLIIEILSRLPVKELGKLRCVCKQWYKLLTRNKEFIAQHTKHTRKNPLLLLRKYSSNFFTEVKKNKVTVELTSINMEGTVINKFSTVIDAPVHTFISSGALAILCSINSLYVLNPSTGEVVSLQGGSSFYTVGFGYLPRSNEYKIIHLFFVPSTGDVKMGSEILTLRDGEGVTRDSWRPIGTCRHIISTSDCLCLNGIVFWEVPKEIVSFDLEKEEYKVYGYPMCDFTKYTSMGLTGFQGTLSVVGISAETSAMDVWLMKDYDGGVWAMEYRVDLFCFDADVIISSDNYSGDVLISTKQKYVIKYSIENLTSTKVNFSGAIEPYRKPCLYYGSLFSLHKIF